MISDGLAARIGSLTADRERYMPWRTMTGEAVAPKGTPELETCRNLLRQTPQQAGDREALRRLLDRASGGVIFTTLQKFAPERAESRFPVLTDRRNVVVIADEAHRSQYGFEARVERRTGAFYDALADNASAREAMGEPALRVIAHELVQLVRSNVTVDWTRRDTARANIRRLVKRLLRKYGYPPDLQDAAVQNVLRQAEALAPLWAA